MVRKQNGTRESLLKEFLKAKGERISTARLFIFQALDEQAPLTTQELVGLAGKMGVDPATVYRTLKLFRTLNLIREQVAEGKVKIELGDEFGDHRHFFLCTNCGKRQEFRSHMVEKSLESAAEHYGIVIQSHRLELTGLCEECNGASSSASFDWFFGEVKV